MESISIQFTFLAVFLFESEEEATKRTLASVIMTENIILQIFDYAWKHINDDKEEMSLNRRIHIVLMILLDKIKKQSEGIL